MIDWGGEESWAVGELRLMVSAANWRLRSTPTECVFVGSGGAGGRDRDGLWVGGGQGGGQCVHAGCRLHTLW